MPQQLMLDVDAAGRLEIVEQRGDRRTSLLTDPLPEPQLRALAALLLLRTEAPAGDGPWACAVAGGRRSVRVVR